ncbi:MAG: DUF4870 domain-containing protein, partial [Candidatus Micrarchaeia archaeon]
MPKEKKEAENVSTDINESKLLGAIAYFLGILAIVLYMIKKDDKFVRFHSVQSIMLSILVMVASMLIMFTSIVLTILTMPLGGIGGLFYVCIFPLALIVLIVVL